MTREDIAKLIAVMKSYERKSNFSHYDMWSKIARSYRFKVEELRFISEECTDAPKRDMQALDAGCGFGVYSAMLAQRGYMVIALDVSTGMLKKTKNLIRRDNAAFVRGSITHLPFNSSRFDLILCLDTLHHLTNSFLETALIEFRRTVKSDGLFITDTKNSFNFALFLQYLVKSKRWAQPGGLTLRARNFWRVKKELVRKGFSVIKAKGVGYRPRFLAPYIVIVSKLIIGRDKGKNKSSISRKSS